MPRRHTGLVVGKEFRPPENGQPLDWCYLTVDLSDNERISVRIRRDQVNKADVGDVVAFRPPRDPDTHAVRRITRLGSEPALLPPVEQSDS